MDYKSEENFCEVIMECLDNENLSAEEIHEKLIESVAGLVEYHENSFRKSQRLFNLLRNYKK